MELIVFRSGFRLVLNMRMEHDVGPKPQLSLGASVMGRGVNEAANSNPALS